jgi:DNA topoisomerase I
MLIIVESPAKAKTISKIVGSKYKVQASVGHIRRITDDSKMPDGRKLEINGIDIDSGFVPLFQVDEAKTDVVKTLKSLAKGETEILFATDSDREGEAISWHLAEILGVKDMSTVKRLEFHEITSKAILHAIANPRPLDIDLVEAQKARQVMDKLVGYKLSPVLWAAMSNYKLSAGRVQSPALRIICEREKEIMNFVATEYWSIKGLFNAQGSQKPNIIGSGEILNIVGQKDTNKSEIKKALDGNMLALELKLSQGNKLPDPISDRKTADQIISYLLKDKDFVITEVKNSFETNSTRPPFITSSLQQAASSKLGMTPKLTMQLAQKLYEGIDIDGSPTGLITYMRTDSVTLSSDALEASRQYIGKKYPEFLPEKPKFYKSKSKNAQEAHEAIRPTDPLRTPESLKGKLDPKMLKLYDLIWRQTIASQMSDEKRERIGFELVNSSQDTFRGSVAWTISLGFKILWNDETQDLSHLKTYFVKGGKFDLCQIFGLQSFTEPPSRYSSASLIKKLEELGIGRPSTYASIISTLQDRQYVEEAKSAMQPTLLGMKVNDILTDNFEQVTGSKMTADMEENLDEISRGEKKYIDVLNEFWGPFKKQVELMMPDIKSKSQEYKTSTTETKCFLCGSEMSQKLGPFGEFYQCLDQKSHMFPLNYLEYKAKLDEVTVTYADQVKGQTCKECKKPLIVRVAKSSLKAYIACPDYKVGNKHTVTDITFGDCPKCKQEGRKGKKMGHLVIKSSRKFGKKEFFACNLPIKDCGYIQKEEKKEEGAN